MHGTLSAAQSATIEASPGVGILPVPKTGANPGSGTDAEFDWFYDCAVAVFGAKETGYHLHLATGWPRTSCYAFVARDPEQRRKVNVEFLRVLFRSNHGRPFFDAFMHGSEAQWWGDLDRAQRLAAAIDAVK